MATKKSVVVLFGILLISTWVLGSAIQAGAETMCYKFYTYATKSERVPIDDVEGHNISLTMRGFFYVFENGEVATGSNVSVADTIKGSGPGTTYATINFADGATIVIKGQYMLGGAPTPGIPPVSSALTGEIIKGTGRFEGIKGTETRKAKYLPLEKGEIWTKGIGEGTLTYTRPSK